MIKDEYISFIYKNYTDILWNPNKYISMVEDKISIYLWWWYVKLLNSWTTALQFWLLALWVKPWDEVILPANTYSATAISITNIGAIPVFADINLDNFTIDFINIEKKITPKTKVIIPVHLYGYSCYMDEIIKISDTYWVRILEDASHAFWWEYKWKKIWTIWDIWAFSCHHSKNFWTLWNGGIFYTKDKELYDKIQNYIYPDNKNIEVLKSLRTPANIWVMESLVLLFKLKYIDKIIESNLNLYNKLLEENKNKWFVFPKLDLINNKLHIRNFTCLSLSRKNYINKWLWKVYYDIDLSESIVFKNISKTDDLKNTKYFFENCFSFNFYFWKN